MQKSKAQIIAVNSENIQISACAARISTQQGTALELIEAEPDLAKNQRLVSRVMASGHQSIAEHQVFSIAFDNVSVFVEQFIIEFRLASFTVKSRRYVDFSNAGYLIPHNLCPSVQSLYDAQMKAQFERYERLVDLGVPREDARFVFPYALRSNFYVTVNGRELAHMILQMTHGRGAAYPEIAQLGGSLAEQFERYFPGVLDSLSAKMGSTAVRTDKPSIAAGEPVSPSVRMIGSPNDPMALLNEIMDHTGRFVEPEGDARLCRLLLDERPRELEFLHYTFAIQNLSLACLTHFTRHRMQSLLTDCVARVLEKGDYVLPERVASQPDALKIYREAFSSQAECAAACLENGLPERDLVYFAMSGHVTDIVIGQNARELEHFIALRTCRRAQWEIQEIAGQMLCQLRAHAPALFGKLGPGCAMTGKCPEGRMTCGHPFPATMPHAASDAR